ncbi:unnamed protein product [Acanthosepion pharaonis]|uniref:Uncharacterized protein n=1 Tax=Acanthosepion pharaonis TaxID=158019 RepID=A0A812EHZ3_ACAPH|nr:unnamed protein product [Sepia pharaonis]
MRTFRLSFCRPKLCHLFSQWIQGVIRAFNALYTKNVLANLLASVDAAQEDENFNLKAYRRQYTIATCLQITQKKLKEIKNAAINESWKNLWPEVIYDDKGFTPAEIQHSAQKALQLAAIIEGNSFADMTTGDIDELLDCHYQPLIDADLEDLKSASKEETQQEMEEIVD